VLHQHKAKQGAQRALLGRPLTNDDFVFANPDGAPLDPSTVSHAFNKVLRKADLPPIRLHDLRHTHATFLLQAGVHPKVVQERLGHSSIRVTLDTYSHVIGGLQEAAAQRFDDFISARVAETNASKNGGKMAARGLEAAIGVAGFEPATT
jgi:integrase